jgi:carboxymethylenebutenolidase
MHDPTEGSVSRRGFVAASLAAGFAMAVQPVTADTIKTDSKGLEAGEVKIETRDVKIPAYRAMPATGGPFPVVLVVQEIFGVHEHIKDICRRFAKLGYLAVAPELYARQGDVSKLTDIKDIIGKVVSKVPDEQVMSDRQGRPNEAWDHRLLLGWANRLAVFGAQQGAEGRRGLVRADRRPAR